MDGRYETTLPDSSRFALTVLPGRIADHKITRIDELMPWSYAAPAT